MGQWALVTGATDGIGRAYADALAKRGLDIILVSRSPFKLQNAAADIENKYKVKTKIIDVDFTTDSLELASRLKRELKELEVGVLINNVGMSYEYPEEFLSMSEGESATDTFIKCNIMSVDIMTRLLLPSMVDRKKGVIVNIASLSGQYTSPFLSLYSATKAYVDFFTRGLEAEYRSKGITIQCVLPGFVASKMSKIRRPNVFAPSPEMFVKSCMKKLGVQSRTNGYWLHEVMSCALDLLPEWMVQKIFFGVLNATRLKALKKKRR
ncbi:HSD17B12 [Lepeophtheirus salmonis]|uniref:HSD17B12 n=1 Tax=Lepeophtheirus salmonis TaxID=72036 RepID=A0A7R8D623_LEPSM|nr:HSD17B12 [Lepeophtheirus salmonis]CAF3040710.1 HSD17B12 [Lepeophtheirus salmonis]